MSYSFISGVAIQIGSEDVLEVMDDGALVLNGKKNFLGGIENKTTGRFAGFLVSKTSKGTQKNILVYDLDLGDGRSIQIRFNRKTGMIFVDVSGTFPSDSVGLLGSPRHDALLARDGKMDLTGEWNTYGENWQVLTGEPKLFQDADRVPQHPVGCIYGEVHDERFSLKTHKLRHRRRLMEYTSGSRSENKVSVVEAEKACAHAAAGVKKQFCIDDVIATNDVELATEEFYN